MKYKRLLDMNMVPEWRSKYLDYQGLDAALNRAIEGKNMREGVRQKGIDLYFELIKFNQKFAAFFGRECQNQLDKIDVFHREKLLEMSGKFSNLQEQLDQVLSSAVYREIQPESFADYNDQVGNNDSCNNTVTSISDVFKSIKGKIVRDSDAGISTSPALQSINLNAQQSSSSKRFSIGASKDKVDEVVRKVSADISHRVKRLSKSFWLSEEPQQLPVNINRRRSQMIGRLDMPSSSSTHLDIGEDLTAQKALFNSAPSQSRKKIIESYKKKISNLKFAFKELYLNLVLFEQYTQLNYTGFEQILRKHDRMFASTLGRKFYQEHVQTADFYNNLQEIDLLLEKVEHVYTLHFANGHRRKAIEELQVPSNIYKRSSPILDFRVGLEIGTFATLFLLVLSVGFLIDSEYDWRTVFRLYRSPLVLIIFLFQMGISIIIWKHYKINHVLIFELNPRNNLSFQHFLELGSLLGILWCISVLIFMFSRSLGICPSLCPLVLVIIIILYLFNPTATGHHQARFWLIKRLGRILMAPFCSVRFADFWIADQLVSIVPLFLDLEYLSCFYMTGEVLSVSYLSTVYVQRCVTRNPQDLAIRTIVAAAPAWFRCAQCLRRWRDENWLRMHIANAGKYGCMVMVVILSSIAQYNKDSFRFDTMRIVWLTSAIFTSTLTAYWDIIYDFGLFSTYDKAEKDNNESQKDNDSSSSDESFSLNEEKDFYMKKSREKTKKYPFLRKELVYPIWVYYFAIVENIILRFGWIFSISLTEFSGFEIGLCVSLLAPLEMFRRFVWNCIRLENEQLNNCGLFRAVRDIPLEVVAPIDESHLEKVIMMMDSQDGPSMRSRMLRRRTLRPDRVSFAYINGIDNHPADTTKKGSFLTPY